MMGEVGNKVLIRLQYLFLAMLAAILIQYCSREEPEPPPNEERAVLVVLAACQEDASDQYLQQLADQYSALPGRPQVVVHYASQENFQTQICLLKDRDNLPDLIFYGSDMTMALASMGVLQDLSGYMGPDKISQYLKIPYTSTIVNGICYGVPFASNPYVLFYNQDYLEKYGGQIPATMAEFHELCRQMHTLGIYSFGMAMKPREDVSSCFLQMVYGAGGSIRNLDTAGCLQLYELLGNMRDERRLTPEMVNWNKNDLLHAFAGGSVKTVAASLSSMAVLEQAGLKFRYGIGELPYLQKPTYIYRGINIGVADRDNEEEAMELLNYFTSPQVLADYYEHAYCLSVRQDITVNPGQGRGLGQGFVERERGQSILKTPYSTWFLISDGFAEALAEFFGSQTLMPGQLGERLQADTRNAIMER